MIVRRIVFSLMKNILVVILCLIPALVSSQIVLKRQVGLGCFSDIDFKELKRESVVKSDFNSFISISAGKKKVYIEVKGLQADMIGTAASAISSNNKHLYTLSFMGKLVEYDIENSSVTGFSRSKSILRQKNGFMFENSLFTSMKVLEDKKYLLVSIASPISKNDFSNYYIIDITRRRLWEGVPQIAPILMSISDD